METELTKRIKATTHSYKPMMQGSNLRVICWADEVTTPTGIVDSIRFEDYIEKDNSYCRKIKCMDDICHQGYMGYSPKACRGCVYAKRVYEKIGMCITCFEVKISRSDFKSPNGHNFVGNRNYYCVPAPLAPKIEALVPDRIGILVYHDSLNHPGLKMHKECQFETIPEGTKTLLLYNAFKKWCRVEQN